MFRDIAQQLIESNRSRMELERLTENVGFHIAQPEEEKSRGCSC